MSLSVPKIIAVILGMEHRKNFCNGYRNGVNATAGIEQFLQTSQEFQKEVDAAERDFFIKPSEIARRKWIALRAQRDSADGVAQTITNHIPGLKEAAMLDCVGLSKFSAACDELNEVLRRRENEIRCDDAARGDALGVTDSSDRALKEIQRIRAELEQVRRISATDVYQSFMRLFNLLGGAGE